MPPDCGWEAGIECFGCAFLWVKVEHLSHLGGDLPGRLSKCCQLVRPNACAGLGFEGEILWIFLPQTAKEKHFSVVRAGVVVTDRCCFCPCAALLCQHRHALHMDHDVWRPGTPADMTWDMQHRIPGVPPVGQPSLAPNPGANAAGTEHTSRFMASITCQNQMITALAEV